MKNDFFVPIVTYPDPTPEAGLLRALDMAATISGKLSVLVAEVDFPDFHNPLAEVLIDVSAMAAKTEQRSREAGDRLATALTAIAHRLALPIAIERQRCHPAVVADDLVAAARTHDAALVVLDPDGSGHIALAEAILFGSGGPMLLCPTADAPGHLMSVAVAWDGSRAAARAVRDALPVLQKANAVSLVVVTDDKEIDTRARSGIVDLLAYHGVTVRVIEEMRGDRPIGTALQDAALGVGAGLLVMGAFGHSRFREFVLGGATASTLRSPRLPILMSH